MRQRMAVIAPALLICATGFGALVPKYSGGRPPKLSAEQHSLIVETGLCPPDLLGQPFRRWSLAKLRDFIIDEKIVESISIETIRQILRANTVKLRRAKTWKECNDPKLRSKKTDPPVCEPAGNQWADDILRRVRPAGDPPATGTKLVSQQQAGSIAGDLPATYRRTHGVRHWLAFYDVHAVGVQVPRLPVAGHESGLHLLMQ